MSRNDEILGAIDALEQEICKKIKPARDAIPKNHEGEEYLLKFQEFRDALHQQAPQFENKLLEIGRSITALINHAGWTQDNEVINLWMRLADCWSHFGGHPTTGVGAIFINSKNELVSYGIYDFAEGLELTNEIVTKGRRRDFLICAERNAMAKKLGITIKFSDQAIETIDQKKERVKDMHARILATAQNQDTFADTVLLTTAPSCDLCAEAVVASKARGVIAKNVDLNVFSRSESIHRGSDILKEKKLQ
jgi:deoxycytidylate deaminase